MSILAILVLLIVGAMFLTVIWAALCMSKASNQDQ